jgi:hypothetical protein
VAVFLRLLKGVEMAEPVTHAGVLLTISGTASAVFGFFFDVPGSTVFAAAAGAFFAVRLGQVIGFRNSLLAVLGGTFAGATLTSLFISWAGPYPQRGVALCLSFCLIHFQDEIFATIRSLLKPGEALRDLLKGLKKS